MFNRVEFIKYFLANGFTFEVACEEADKGRRLHDQAEADFQAKVAAAKAAKIEAVARVQSDILLWDAMDAVGAE